MADGQNLNFNQPFNVSRFLAGGSGVNNEPAQTGGGMWDQFLSGGKEVLSDPNFQRALAEIGAGIDPQGAGGNIGRAAQGYIQRNALAELAGQGNRVKIGPDGSIDVTPQQQKEGVEKSKLAGETQAPEPQERETQGFNLDDITDRINQMIGE